jgi:urease accessory protein
MHVADPVHLRSWRAELELRYQRRGERTVLAERRHDGPLVVQKPLYPEGDAVCHTIILHPPAGIVGGDELEIQCDAATDAHVLLTTPGAGKWYRSAGPWAKQRLTFNVDAGACLEWLPQETIVFDGALGDMESQINLASGATYIGWEILCLGRAGSGERYDHGTCRLHTKFRRDGKLLWFEKGNIEAGGRIGAASAGLGGHSVCATMIAAGNIDAALVARCREDIADDASIAMTLLPGPLLVVRHLGNSGTAARQHFEKLRTLLRPALTGRAAVEPRIWRT